MAATKEDRYKKIAEDCLALVDRATATGILLQQKIWALEKEIEKLKATITAWEKMSERE